MIHLRTSGLLFDSDGVLVDSHEAAAIAWNDWAATWAPLFDFHRDIVHGRRLGDSVAQLVSADVLDDAVAALVEGEMNTTSGVTAMPGAQALLASLPSGCWVVVTSALRELAFARLHAAQLREPERLVAAEDVTHGKPHAEPYLAGSAALGLPPAGCTVFEDAPAGIAAALAAGIGTIVGIGQAAVGAGADIVVPDLRWVTFTDGMLIVDDDARLDRDPVARRQA